MLGATILKAIRALAVAPLLAVPADAGAQPSCLAGFKNPQRSFPYNEARPVAPPLALEVGEPLGNVTYRPRGQPADSTLDNYLGQFCTTSFLVLHKGLLVQESYFQGVKPDDALLSASMSKTVLALLVGVAIAQGKLALHERVAEILPDFAESAFGNATIESLLRMDSGAALKNSYLPGEVSDNQATNPMLSPQQSMRGYLRGKRQPAPAGVRFHYNGAVTALLGLLLSERTGMSNTDYLARTLWGPAGFEGSAYWIKNRHGEEGVQGQLAVRPRDWARLARLVQDQGAAGGRQWVPRDWIAQMTALRTDKPQPKGPPFYGLHIWIPQAAGGRSHFAGTNGQYIFIDPVAQVVIVHTANHRDAMFAGGDDHLFPLRNAIVAKLSKR